MKRRWSRSVAIVMVSVLLVLFATREARAETPSPYVPTFHGGVALGTDFAPNGGAWVGGSGSFGVRWFDVLELRVDTELAILNHSTARRDCYSKDCVAGSRGVLTHSIGARIPLGSVRFSSETFESRKLRHGSIDLTPSIGYALGSQTAVAGYGASTFDAATPSQWALLAPGLGISVGPFEARARVRMHRGEIRSPTIELEVFGLYF